MKKSKKILTLLLSSVLLVSCKPFDKDYDYTMELGIGYKLSEDKTSYLVDEIVLYSEGEYWEEKDVVIPDEYKGLPVTGFTESSYCYSDEDLYEWEERDKVYTLDSLTLGKNFTQLKLSNNIFDCVKEINVGEGVSEITGYLESSIVTKITLNDKISSIPQGAFSDCTSLETVVFTKETYEIGEEAFANCTNLKNLVNFDLRSKWIKEDAFGGCTSLESIIIPLYSSVEPSLFDGCTSLTDVVSYANIANHQFSGCSSLTNVIIGEGAYDIGRQAFFGCESLKSIYLPKSLRTIREDAFDYYCKLETIYYAGSEEEWKQVEIHKSNYLPDNIVYNYSK